MYTLNENSLGIRIYYLVMVKRPVVIDIFIIFNALKRIPLTSMYSAFIS
jgi:hypothetical protein